MHYERNTKKQVTYRVPDTDITIPATLLCGRKAGKTITISAGVHSREYIGIETLIRLAQELTPEMVQGTILLLHCCNYKGFLSRSSDVMPQDGKNLNRVFPGAADGTPTQKLAAFLESEIIGHTDYLVDLHSGGFCEALVPHVYYHGAAKPSVCAESFRIAEMTSAKFLVRSETKTEHIEAATELVKWMSGVDSGVLLYEKTKSMPSTYAAYDQITTFEEDENYKALYEQLRDYGHPRPKTPVYPQVSTSFQQVLEDVGLSGKNVTNEMDKSVERINAKLKRYTR